MMNSLQVRYFLLVAKHLSFSEAAKEVFISQPAISRHVNNLEIELGVPLFERSGRNVKLTTYGAEYCQLFLKFGSALEEIRQKSRASNASEQGVVRISIFPAWSISNVLEHNSKMIHNTYPNLQVLIEGQNSGNLISDIQEGKVDAIFHFLDILKNTKGIKVVKLCEIPNILVYSAKHPLIKKENLSIENFRNENFFYTTDSNLSELAIKKMVKSTFRKYGFTPKTTAVSNLDSKFFILERGDGFTLMDNWSRAKLNPVLRYITLDTTQEIGLGWSENNNNPNIDLFIEETIINFRNMSGGNFLAL